MKLENQTNLNASKPDRFDGQIFITGALKTGTTLLLALLDYHPDIFAFPFELKYHKLFNSLANGDECELFRLNNYFLNESKFMYFKKNQHNDPYNTGMLDFENVNYNRIEGYLNGLEKGNYKRRDYLYHLAQSLKQGMNEQKTHFRYLLEKPGNHALELIDQIRGDYPEAKIIHVIRNPKDNLASAKLAIKNYDGTWGKYRPFEIINKIKKGFEVARENTSKENYYVIKYEDLVRQPREAMSKIAEWLNIPWDETLIQPSALGQAWAGNSSANDKFDAISDEPMNRADGIIGTEENKMLEYLLKDYYEQFGYEAENAHISPIFKCKTKLFDQILIPATDQFVGLIYKIFSFKRYPRYFQKIKSKLLGRGVTNE